MSIDIINKCVRIFLAVLYVYTLRKVCYTFTGGDYMPYNETAYKASQKYKAGNIKRVPLDMQKSTYEEIKAHAEAHSESVNGFIKRAISETMERDNGAPTAFEGHTEVITGEDGV